MRQICSAIAVLHAKLICHRDIKPDNFLCTAVVGNVNGHAGEQPRPSDKTIILKLADFGLSVYVPPGQMLTQKCGTPAFMAPELYRLPDQSPGYSFPVDVWAAGVTLCLLMCAGQHPFFTSSGGLDVAALEHGALPFASQSRATLGSRLFGTSKTEEDTSSHFAEVARTVCRQMVDPDPRRRLSAAAVLQHGWMLQGVKSQSAAVELQPKTSLVAMPIGPIAKPPDATPNEPFAPQQRQASGDAIDRRGLTLPDKTIAPLTPDFHTEQSGEGVKLPNRAVQAQSAEVTILRQEANELRERNTELEALVAQRQANVDVNALPSRAEQAQNLEVAMLRQEANALRERNKELDALVAQLQAKANANTSSSRAEQVQDAEVAMLRQETSVLRFRNQELDDLVTQLRLKAVVNTSPSGSGQADNVVGPSHVGEKRDELGDARVAQLEV